MPWTIKFFFLLILGTCIGALLGNTRGALIGFTATLGFCLIIDLFIIYEED